jgi:hypothetical protein
VLDIYCVTTEEDPLILGIGRSACLIIVGGNCSLRLNAVREWNGMEWGTSVVINIRVIIGNNRGNKWKITVKSQDQRSQTNKIRIMNNYTSSS